MREDTAKAFRGVKWAHIVVIIGLALMVILTLGFFIYTGMAGNIFNPAANNNSFTK